MGAVVAGQSFSAIAHRYAMTKGEVRRLVAKHRQTGSVKDHPRSGRPRVITDREDRMIAHHARQNRFKMARQIRDDLQGLIGRVSRQQTAHCRLAITTAKKKA